MSRVPRGETLTANERKWVENVVLGMTDTDAYVEAYGCTVENARTNAFTLRTRKRVMVALDAAWRRKDELTSFSLEERKGRLARIARTGKDHDAIRAVKVYSDLEGDFKRVGDQNEATDGILDILKRMQHKPKA